MLKFPQSLPLASMFTWTVRKALNVISDKNKIKLILLIYMIRSH